VAQSGRTFSNKAKVAASGCRKRASGAKRSHP
jgi:hypothetical protein